MGVRFSPLADELTRIILELASGIFYLCCSNQ